MAAIAIRALSPGWVLTPLAPRRGRPALVPDPFAARLDPSAVAVDGEYLAEARRPRAGIATPRRLALEVIPPGAEQVALMLRLPSGAIRFQFPEAAGPRRRGAPRRLCCTIELPDAESPVRRGPLTGALRIVVLRLLGGIVRSSLPALARRWEKRSFRERGIKSGFVRILGGAAGDFALQPVAPSAADAAQGPILLMLHGTFSDTAGSYAKLAPLGFYAQARERYGARIHGFEHPTVGTSIADNLDALWSELPHGAIEMDVIGYSRGSLFARALLARARAGGDPQRQVRIGKVVLVAGPQQGTALARPQRYRDTLGWLANLLDALPDNPLTSAMSWVSGSLSWFAAEALGVLPGLADMDPDGPVIAAFRERGSSDVPACHAAVTEFEASGALRLRLADALVDAFFAEANDLVVPTAGGWQLGPPGAAEIEAARRLSFAPKAPGAASEVHHLNILAQPATAGFLLAALGATTQRRSVLTRGGRKGRPAGPAATAPASAAGGVPAAIVDDSFHLLVLGDPEARPPRPETIVASWRGARVVERYRWGKGGDGPAASAGTEAGRRWRQIIRYHQRLIDVFRGEPAARALSPTELEAFGHLLFAALFGGSVGRLYDEARGHHGGRRLHLVLNSNVPRWAEKPWELAIDPARGSPLAIQDIHLVRDVLGMLPTEQLPAHPGPLRILVVQAQPVDAAALSVAAEAALIERGFAELAAAGRVSVEVLARATPASLHERLARGRGRFDVLHFVGHGEYDEAAQAGLLLFEDGQGRGQALGERELGRLLAGRGLRLVFLNACESARGGGYSAWMGGLAPALLRLGIPAVIANQFAVDDLSALGFAQQLYARLAEGMSLAEAVREARIALCCSAGSQGLDWAVPALYTRVPGLRLIGVSNGSLVMTTGMKGRSIR